MSDVVVHHLERSRSHRVLWLLEELGQPYTVTEYARGKGRRAPDTLKAVHPLGRSPAVQIGDLVVVESGHVIETLLDHFDPEGTLRPAPGTPEALRYRFFLHYAEGSLMPPLFVKLLTSMLRKAPWPARLVTRPAAAGVDRTYTDAEIANHLGFLEQELSGRTWATGDTFSAADIQLSYPLSAAMRGRANVEGYPALAAYVARYEARPAYRKAVEVGGRPV